MSLHEMLHDYLSIRRALGFKLERYGGLLPDFLAFLEREGSPVITTALALAWAVKPTAASPTWWASRLDTVRQFARYARALDPRNDIPPYDLLPRFRHRPSPYIYTELEVVALMAAADRVGDPLRALTYRTLVGLLASTGMRVGEAIALDQADLDGEPQILTVRQGKFGKSRQVPLHPSAFQALEEYASCRNRRFRRSRAPAFFLSLTGTRLIYQNVHLTFLRMVERAGLAGGRPRRPRIHDLRHTFAVRTLLDWYRAGVDVESRLPVLSTYLGHIAPSTTYWYLSAVPELAAAAAERFERGLGGLP